MDFKIGGRIIETMKYVGGIVLLAKEKVALLDMIDRVVKTGRNYEMIINVDGSKVMGISRREEPLQIIMEHQEIENVDQFSYS